MNRDKPATRKESNKTLMRYLGLGTQLFAMLIIGLWIGKKLDLYFSFSFPLLVWLLPMLIIVSSLIKIIIDTNKKGK